MNFPATIQKIVKVAPHDNADSLDIATVKGYECIVKREQYKEGDLIVFIEPDSQLPDKKWAEFYKAKSNRVKAIKLRNRWSFGIIESISNVEYGGPIVEGLDISNVLGVTHWEPPQPQDLQAKGGLPHGIVKTDEERFQSLDSIPYGEICDVTLKIDGQNINFYYKLDPETLEHSCGVTGRTMEWKQDADNNYTRNEKKHSILAKLKLFCDFNKVNLCIRGESYGVGIQKFAHNPHAKLPVDLAFFSTWNIDKMCYERKGSPLYIFDLAKILGLPTVPMIEKDVVLTKELIKKYDEELTEINGQPFEGVVINWRGGSFKIINKSYDSKKG